MNKKLSVILGLVLCTSSALMARQIRTPEVPDFGYMYAHYPFDRPVDNCWNVNVWGLGLHRDACRAFLDKNTADKENLSALIFGKQDFKGIEAFASEASAMPFNPCLATNPLLLISDIKPRISYSENTAFFGVVVERVFGCECDWVVGLRANLPYRSLKTELDNCCELADVTLDDLVKQQDEVVVDEAGDRGIVQSSFAWRLDLLSALNYTANPQADIPTSAKFLKYQSPTGVPGNNLSLNDEDITNAATPPNPVTVIKRPDGTCPKAPFALNQAAVDALAFLPNDGSGGSENDRFRFQEGNELYVPLSNNQVNQSQLWVVPTVLAEAPDSGEYPLVQAAEDAQTTFDRIIKMVSNSPLDFFEGKEVSFASQCKMGVGDLNTELYVRKDWCNFFWEGIFGVFWPTGKRIEDPNKLLLQPTGNNRHFEVKIGTYGGWNPCEWFGLKVDAFYAYALKRTERVAAAFQGATVKNIGPAVDADVQWGRFLLDVDATFVVPCVDQCLGFDVGYQFYLKQKDKIKFDQTMAEDFFGVERPLDADVLELRTDQYAHKLKGELFYQECNWHLYTGFQHVFAGKNAPNDTDWYLGFQVYFY